MSEKLKLNRRKFLKTAGVGAAAAASIAGVDVTSVLAAPPPKWDEEADVLVVGYGGAGAVTALTAAENGANVMILEKNPFDHHVCNSNLNGGQFIAPTDVEKAFIYAKACFGDTVDDEMVHLWAELTSTNREYIIKLAQNVGDNTEVQYRQGAEFADLPGADGIATWNLGSGSGWKIFEIMDKNVRTKKNIRISWSSPAKKIVQDPKSGEVLGIICERNGKEVAVRGRRATVLTCGGYEFNDTLKRNTLFGNPRYFYGTDSNTGDGVLMSMAVGAGLWHLNWTSQHLGFGNKHSPSFGGLRGSSKHSWIIVDQYGKRFFNESYNGHSAYLYFCMTDPVKASWPRLPSFLICDESVRVGRGGGGGDEEGGEGAGAKMEEGWIKKGINQWRASRAISVADQIAKGWIMKADTIGDLCKQINSHQGPNPNTEYPSRIKMDPATLAATINAWNASKKDTEFGRMDPAPIEKAPFYALEMYPVGPNTQGGPRFDAKGRVVDPYGKPIPRLYKAGELGSIYGALYPAGGGNNAENMGFGRLVGKNAAKEKPQA